MSSDTEFVFDPIHTLRFAARIYIDLGASQAIVDQAKRAAKEELDRKILKAIGAVDYDAIYRYYEPQAPNFPLEGSTPRRSVIAEALVKTTEKRT